MALTHSTLLLAVLVVAASAADSPLKSVNVEEIVDKLGTYFSNLANDALSVEIAQVSLAATHPRTHRAVSWRSIDG